MVETPASPSCLSDEQLTPVAVGEVPLAGVAEHLEQCADCRRRLQRLEREIGTVRGLFAELKSSGRWPDGSDTTPSDPQHGRSTAGALCGQTLGRYVLLEEIGRGGMGEVYKARDDRMGRVVAVKVLSRTAIVSPESVGRFQREVRAAARLSHPNIVTAHDADESDGVHFLVMEYVDGTDLASLAKEHGPLPVEQAVDYVRQAACALQYAHDQGIIHRDIKPGNLLVDRKNRVKVLDMGLARFDRQAASPASLADGLTHDGQLMGSLDYLAPEQAVDPNAADRRADIYGLGCTLFFLLTGRPVYRCETVLKSVVAHREQPVPRLRDLRKEVPEAIDALFQKMVAKRAEDRPAAMSDVVAAIDACGLSAPRPARKALPAAILAAAALVAVSVAGYVWWHSHQPPERENDVTETAHDPLEDNAEAYGLYRKGQDMVKQRQERQMGLALGCFESAAKMVPTSALAHTALADAHNLRGDYGWEMADRAFPLAKKAALRALECNERSPDAHLALAFTLIEYDCDWKAAGEHHRRAVELAPASAEAHHWYAWYFVLQRRLDEAESHMQQAQRLALGDVIVTRNAGKIQYYARNFHAAVEKYKEALDQRPDFRKAHIDLGMAYVQLGEMPSALREFALAKSPAADSSDLILIAAEGFAHARNGDGEKARDALAKLEPLAAKKSIAYEIATIHAALGDKDTAFAWLERAFREHSAWRCYIKVDPRLDALRSDRRFETFLQQAGLAAAAP